MSQIAGTINPSTTTVTPEGSGVVLKGIEGTGQNNITGTANTIRIEGTVDGGPLLAGAANPVVIYGFGGPDSIVGSSGNDQLYGNEGSDTIYGLGGNDLIYGGQGNDLLYGGDGDDSINGDDGDDAVYGGAGNDQLAGGAGKDLIDGGDGNDTLFGEEDNDSLYGGAGNDTIYGGQGNDIIAGGDGNDLITGDKGNDNLSGNAGSDTFLFNQVGSANADVVVDFTSGSDKIALGPNGDGNPFASLGVSVEASEFQVIANFNPATPGTAAGLVYDSANGKLYFLTGGAAQEVATFVNKPTLQASDFELF